MTANVRLSVRQQRAVEARIAGGSWREVSRAARVSERTCRRWRATLTFAGALRAAQDGAFAEGLDVLKGNVMRAAETLAALLGDAEAGIRLRAASCVLETALRSAEVYDVLQRIDALEAQIGRPAQRIA